jgi:hypothetical protein
MKTYTFTEQDLIKLIEKVYNDTGASSDCSDWYGVNLDFDYGEVVDRALQLADQITKDKE